MKQLNGKRLKIWDCNGHVFEGLCTGSTDDCVRLLQDGGKDEITFNMKGYFAYQIVGGGVTGGYSGLQAYVCKNPSINCAGRCLLSSNPCHIEDMNCEVYKKSNAQGHGFVCDFGSIGAMEIIPPQVQRVLFDGMVVDRNKRKNYLEDAKKEIVKEKKERKENQENKDDGSGKV